MAMVNRTKKQVKYKQQAIVAININSNFIPLPVVRKRSYGSIKVTICPELCTISTARLQIL
jgi:hypothetical protein